MQSYNIYFYTGLTILPPPFFFKVGECDLREFVNKGYLMRKRRFVCVCLRVRKIDKYITKEKTEIKTNKLVYECICVKKLWGN